ncbi:ENTH-domain-containing protein [Coemansia reversa NRRL 1564]|uniref:ENTH-domain-containing protein n=1 Tax=Coemansia reversa (strain ATCC 12441 / NRRL 1564) TaxID=763665 RepID=A0A2G5BE29_COERN|nr:ENTH-domain-containing protein [Coemansia reversa NRRL 1564]|eukprot:PIA17264.1 ENTH-domain-containing protein [Coemansia reversa NRRL 1564]
MSAKGVLRTVKNYTKGYTPIQMKVRKATSNEPGSPPGSLMSEIAQATFNQTDFLGVMEIIDKRMNDKGRLWRHVFKALTVLDFLLHAGSPYVVEYAIDNIFIVKTLREFQHIDDSGRDQGSNVRQKAKELTALLSDPAKLKEERKNRNWMSNRMGFEPPMGPYNGQYASSSSRLPYGSSRSESARSRPAHRRGGSLSTAAQRYGDDDSEMRKAIAESKRDSTKRMPTNYDEDAELRRAIEESAREAKEKEENSSKAIAPNTVGETDLLGAFDDEPAPNTAMTASTNNLSSFNMANNSTMSFNQQQFASSSATGDLLGAFGGGQMGSTNQFTAMSTMNTASNMSSTNNILDGTGGMGGMNNMGGMNSMSGLNNMGGVGNMNNAVGGMSTMGGSNNFDPFGLGSTGNNGMGMNSGMETSSALSPGMGVGTNMNMMGQQAPMGISTPGTFDANTLNTSTSQFMSNSAMSATRMESTSAGINPFGQSGTQQQQGTDLLGMGGGASGAFGNAFDGGAGAKALPFGADASNPNARLAEIARNSEKIDPFASLALGSSATGNPFASAASNPGQNTPGTSTMALTSMATTPGIPNAGGSSLMDFNVLTPASSTGLSQQQSFGQANRNPFASDGSSAMSGTMGGKQPSLNQLMSGTTSSNQFAMNASNSFSQQQAQQQGHNGMNAFSNINAQSQTTFQQQQQQQNPFAQGNATNGQPNFFGL